MAYTRLNLANDDVLDETHLAHLEDGIAAAEGAWELINSIEFTEEVASAEVTFDKTYRKLAITILSPNLTANRTLVYVLNGRSANAFSNNIMGSTLRYLTIEFEITDAFIRGAQYISASSYYAISSMQPFSSANGRAVMQIARNKDVDAMLNAGDEGIYSMKMTASTTAFLAGDTVIFSGVPV